MESKPQIWKSQRYRLHILNTFMICVRGPGGLFWWKKDTLTSYITEKDTLTSCITKQVTLTSYITEKDTLTDELHNKNDTLTSYITKKDTLTSYITKKDTLTSYITKQDRCAEGCITSPWVHDTWNTGVGVLTSESYRTGLTVVAEVQAWEYCRCSERSGTGLKMVARDNRVRLRRVAWGKC